MSVQENKVSMISIGALSRGSGIPTETIRTWERRYGFPEPVRRASGHRRYPLETVEHLRLIKRALDKGHKPSTTVSADLRALQQMLDLVEAPPDEGEVLSEALAPWMAHIRGLDGESLLRLMVREWNTLGAMRFVESRVAPLLTTIGQQWRSGHLSVMHEHFASERLRDFLAHQWQPMSDASRGPLLVCATLPDEAHVLGLHLVAVVLAMADIRLVFLGANTPIADIALATETSSAKGVVLSISQGARETASVAHLGALRAALSPETPVIVGGMGAPAGLEGITLVPSLDELHDWALGLDRSA